MTRSRTSKASAGAAEAQTSQIPPKKAKSKKKPNELDSSDISEEEVVTKKDSKKVTHLEL